MTSALFDSHIPNLPLIHRGKVRDIYGVDDKHLLIVTTDRLSAFDVILPTPIPGKGEVLTQTALFWFKRFEKLIPNHLATDLTLEDVIPDALLRAELAPRTMLVKKLKALPIEAIARGYLIGSGWKDYQATGKVCGIPLPAGLRLADKLPEPIYTPSSKAAVGEHDENIDFDATVRLVGPKLAEQVRDMTLRIYKEAADYALQRGIIIADTKFEFGVDEHGTLHLIDEVLTPDSSRFWPLDTYAPGKSPESFDKQFVRDWLETLDWDKTPPGPELPAEIVERTASKYREALQRLTA
ncbi:MAG: phosphoribosylaminoimidazolesuccinocarboxamide synthase [Pseudomonadota bacterium]|jgi:phosphoribosylaminoimidazole-succinocarboxamide synthase